MDKPIEQQLVAMQEDQRRWATDNFGTQTPIQMMMGILGELGEFLEHLEENDNNAVEDDIGDVGVYLMNYCNLKGWSVVNLLEDMKPQHRYSRISPYNVVTFVRWLPHHQLKGDQNIRGGTAFHEAKVQEFFSYLLWQLNEVARELLDSTFFDCLCKACARPGRR